MTHAEIMEKLQDVFREVFDDASLSVSDETTAADIEEWDSLTHLELISTVEDTFNVHFSIGEINNFENVGAMCECILKHLQ